MSIRYYAATDVAGDVVPRGIQRISLAQIDATGEIVFHVEDSDGGFYLCNKVGENVGRAARWTLLEPLADIPDGDAQALLRVIQGPCGSHELR